jgi:NAD-dependent SIR2 family protein deacetylase
MSRPLRCRLGFHKLTTLHTHGWFDRVRCIRCNKTGWFPAEDRGVDDAQYE